MNDDGDLPRALSAADALEAEARARLAAIVDSSQDAIVSKTLDGIITTWNRAAERMFGYSAAEAIGSPILRIIPPDRHDEETAVLASIHRGEVVEPFDTVRIRKDGSEIDVSITVSPVRDSRGGIVGASKIARDIGDRKRIEAERARLLRAEQEANAAKDRFLAMLGHELRNPLGAVVSALHLLDRVAGRDEAAAARARAVGMRQAKHLAKLLDDLIDVSRVMTGKISIHPEPLDLAEAVRAHVSALRATGRLEKHSVSVEVAPVTVDADAVRLEQIVANLLDNALRYTPAGGSIRLVVERAGADAVLRVEDDGSGIDAALLPRVFELFVQSERKLDRSLGGLGLGLALVRGLVELQGGTVEAASEGPGRGSRFVVRLPARARPVGRTAVALSAVRVRPRRVLVVEDNEDVRDMLCGVLRAQGHEVHEASSGSEGIDAALRLRPRVVVLDIGLPDVDGYEAARAIRAQLGPATYLGAATGYGSREDARRAAGAGFDLHLRKPIEPADLEAVFEGLEDGAASAP